MADESIHADGTVELTQRWRPGGAQGASPDVLDDGETYLLAIHVREQYGHDSECVSYHWEISMQTAVYDEDVPLTFEDDHGDVSFGWEWDLVMWFMPLCELDLPITTKAAAT